MASFLPDFAVVQSCYERLGSEGGDLRREISEVSRRLCQDQVELRGIGRLQIQYEAGNWYAYPPGDSIMVNRHDFLIPLVQSYVLDADADSRDKINALFEYWVDNFEYARLIRCDTPIDAAIRLLNWLWVFNTDALRVDERGLVKLLEIIYLQLEYIYVRQSAGGNHLVLEALVHYVYGSIFRNIPYAAKWRKWGRLSLVGELFRQTTPDGVHTEQSMFYHQAVSTHYLKFFLTARAFGDGLDATAHQRFQLMLDYVHHSVMPNLTHPVTGDGEALVTEDREHWEARSLLAARWALFDRPVYKDFRPMIDDSAIWLLGCTEVDVETSVDTPDSRVYEHSGLAVLRNGDRYLFVDGAPFSDPEFPHHGHADALSFVLVAGNDELFVDPGGYGYYDDEFRRFFRSTAAHNTITLDGHDQSELFGVLGYGRLAQASIDEYRLTQSVDYVAVSHDGYDPVLHSREFYFYKQPHSALIIVDHLSGPGRHRGVSRFHAAPAATIDLTHSRIRTPGAAVSGYQFAFAATMPLQQNIVKGRRSGTLQGWVSPETRKVAAAETLELGFEMDGDCRIITAVALEEGLPVTARLATDLAAIVTLGPHEISFNPERNGTSLRRQ